MENANRVSILFLCTGNACRSQMAEGWAKAIKADSIAAYSAGVAPHGVNPLAVEVMREVGVDISQNISKHVDSLKDQKFDFVVTVCDGAREVCPVFPGSTTHRHVPFEDPPQLALKAENESEALECYRKVRDEIREFIKQLPEVLWAR